MFDMLKHSWKRTPKLVRQVLVGIIGVLFILTGMALWFLPGPGWATIFVGLLILQTEFGWAARLKEWIVTHFKSALEELKKSARKKNK